MRAPNATERPPVADAINTAREAIESRIREIEEETKRLRGVVAELIGGDHRPTVRRGGSRPRRWGARRRRKVAPRGQRREQLLAHLEQNPGAKPAEIARAMGTTPANVQNVLRKARQEGWCAGGGMAATRWRVGRGRGRLARAQPRRARSRRR